MSPSLAASVGAGRMEGDGRVAIVQHVKAGEALRITFDDLGKTATHVGALLRRHVGIDGSVGIYMRRSIEHVAVVSGAVEAGIPYFSINATVRPAQLPHMAEIASAHLIVADNTGLLKIAGIVDSGPWPLQVLHYRDGPLTEAHHKALDKLRRAVGTHEVGSPDGTLTLEDPEASSSSSPACLLFTSGSTGSPRGVMVGGDDLLLRARSETAAYGISSSDRLLSLLPFGFDVGCNQLYTALISGAELVVLNSWAPKDICYAIEEYGITGISGVPAIWKSILEYDETTVRQALSKLRYLTVSGGDLDEPRLIRLQSSAPGLQIYKTYGQTETFRSGMLLPHEFSERRRSVGRPPEGVHVSILMPDGSRAAPGEVGEVIHEGVGVMLGYAGDPEATEAKIRPHPFYEDDPARRVVYTGDRGWVDDDGYLYLSGRMDRMVKIRGNRVYPEEIELQLRLLPGVRDAALVVLSGAEDPELVAAVVLESTADVKATQTLLAARVPTYMMPDRIVVVDQLPATSTGKVELRTLESMLAEMSSPT